MTICIGQRHSSYLILKAERWALVWGKGCSSGWGVCTVYPSGGRCLHSNDAAEGRGHSADLGLRKVPRPFSWGRDRQQTCLQKVCPGGWHPAAKNSPTSTCRREGGQQCTRMETCNSKDHLPRSLRCPGKTTSPLCRLKRNVTRTKDIVIHFTPPSQRVRDPWCLPDSNGDSFSSKQLQIRHASQAEGSIFLFSGIRGTLPCYIWR